jgi:hypothetical protein
MLKFLREYNFRFMLTDRMKAMNIPISIKERHQDYQFMVRCIKEAKDPSNDKFDPLLAFGFKILPDRSEEVQIYVDGDWSKKIKVPFKVTKAEIFRKGEYTKFPDFMEEGERERWRKEDAMIIADPNRVPSKFYNRWVKYIDKK